MQVHITNLHGQDSKSTAQRAQNMVTEIATKQLDFNEMGLYCYPVKSDSPDKLSGRLDGIISALNPGDVVILQTPTWNGTHYEHRLLDKIRGYSDVKIIAFIHDVEAWMFEGMEFVLDEYIKVYNRCDLVISPTEKMTARLRKHGLTVKKVINQEFWDHPVAVDTATFPPFNRVVNFIGRGKKFDFVKNWSAADVKLILTDTDTGWGAGKNIEFIGYQNDADLVSRMHRTGGFGLVWSENPLVRDYMKYCVSYKLSTYLAAGIPVIVEPDTPQANTILTKKLGLVVNSLDEAVEQVKQMTPADYQEMVVAVEHFAQLIRGGYFTKRLLTQAVFDLFYD